MLSAFLPSLTAALLLVETETGAFGLDGGPTRVDELKRWTPVSPLDLDPAPVLLVSIAAFGAVTRRRPGVGLVLDVAGDVLPAPATLKHLPIRFALGASAAVPLAVGSVLEQLIAVEPMTASSSIIFSTSGDVNDFPGSSKFRTLLARLAGFF